MKIGQLSQKVMISLENTLQELLVDKLVKQRINEYNTLINKLQTDASIRLLRVTARQMHTKVHGDAILGGYPACELCDPDKPVDLQPSNVTDISE